MNKYFCENCGEPVFHYNSKYCVNCGKIKSLEWNAKSRYKRKQDRISLSPVKICNLCGTEINKNLLQYDKHCPSCLNNIKLKRKQMNYTGVKEIICERCHKTINISKDAHSRKYCYECSKQRRLESMRNFFRKKRLKLLNNLPEKTCSLCGSSMEKDLPKHQKLCLSCVSDKNKTKQFYYLQAKSYYRKQRGKTNEKSSLRFKNDIQYRLKICLRNRIRKVLRNKIQNIRFHTRHLLGCDIKTLKAHLESQFKEGMSWENIGKWHLDHIIPCSSFDLSNLEEQRICFNYFNLQPLWAKDNMTKWKKLPENHLEIRSKIEEEIHKTNIEVNS